MYTISLFGILSYMAYTSPKERLLDEMRVMIGHHWPNLNFDELKVSIFERKDEEHGWYLSSNVCMRVWMGLGKKDNMKEIETIVLEYFANRPGETWISYGQPLIRT